MLDTVTVITCLERPEHRLTVLSIIGGPFCNLPSSRCKRRDAAAKECHPREDMYLSGSGKNKVCDPTLDFFLDIREPLQPDR